MTGLPSEIKTTEDFQTFVYAIARHNELASKCAVYNLSIANGQRWNIANNMLHAAKSGNLNSIINTARKHGYTN